MMVGFFYLFDGYSVYSLVECADELSATRLEILVKGNGIAHLPREM